MSDDKLQNVALREALNKHLEWRLGAYDGPDWPRNADHTTWYIRSMEHFSVTVEGQNPPASIADALAPTSKRVKEIEAVLEAAKAWEYARETNPAGCSAVARQYARDNLMLAVHALEEGEK